MGGSLSGVRWDDFALPEQQRRIGCFALRFGLLLRFVSFGLMTYALFEMVKDTLGWRFLSVVVLGNYFFHSAYIHRIRGQLILSRIDAYREQHGHDAPGEVPTSLLGPQLSAKAVIFDFAAISPFMWGAHHLISGLRTLWVGIKNGHLKLLQILNIIINLDFGILCLAASVAVSRIALRKGEKVISSPKDVAGSPYVLYLRPFGIDFRLARREQPVLTSLARGIFPVLGMNTDEYRLALTLRSAGPMICVGRPREPSPFHGATRMYLPLDNWQEPVRELMLRSQLTVLVLGSSTSMLWELSEALRVLQPERLIVLVPFGRARYDSVRRVIEKELRAQAGSAHCVKERGPVTPLVLPDYVDGRWARTTIKGIIHFTADWQPEFVPLTRPPFIEDQLMGALDRALWPAMLNLTEHEATGRTGVSD